MYEHSVRWAFFRLGFLIVECVDGGVINRSKSIAKNSKPVALESYVKRLSMLLGKTLVLKQIHTHQIRTIAADTGSSNHCSITLWSDAASMALA